MIKPSMVFWLKICSTQLILLGWQRCGESRVPSFSEVALLQASECCQEAAVPQEPFAQPGGAGWFQVTVCKGHHLRCLVKEK